MMKTLSNKGLTLLELVIASVLITIVMSGVVAFSVTLRNMHATTSQSTILSIRSSAVLSHITRSATQAIGDKLDAGIRFVNNSYFSFRQDVNGTPGNTADDLWHIYYGTPNFVPTGFMYYCTISAALDATAPWDPLAGDVTCSTAGSLALLQNITALTYDFTPDEAAAKFRFEISVTTRFNASQPVDPIDNPELTLATYVVPIPHTW